MKPVIYVDHIKPINTSQAIGVGSIVQISTSDNNKIVALVRDFNFSSGVIITIVIKDSAGQFNYGSIYSGYIANARLISCTIKIKQ